MPCHCLIQRAALRKNRTGRDVYRNDGKTAAGIYYVFHDPQTRAEIGQSLCGIKESENRRLLVTENAARGEPVAHRGVFGRRGRAPFGEFLALFRQQFH